MNSKQSYFRIKSGYTPINILINDNDNKETKK